MFGNQSQQVPIGPHGFSTHWELLGVIGSYEDLLGSKCFSLSAFIRVRHSGAEFVVKIFAFSAVLSVRITHFVEDFSASIFLTYNSRPFASIRGFSSLCFGCGPPPCILLRPLRFWLRPRCSESLRSKSGPIQTFPNQPEPIRTFPNPKVKSPRPITCHPTPVRFPCFQGFSEVFRR
jgi:hypothetical protein